jgi:hypothetical protein
MGKSKISKKNWILFPPNLLVAHGPACATGKLGESTPSRPTITRSALIPTAHHICNALRVAVLPIAFFPSSRASLQIPGSRFDDAIREVWISSLVFLIRVSYMYEISESSCKSLIMTRHTSNFSAYFMLLDRLPFVTRLPRSTSSCSINSYNFDNKITTPNGKSWKWKKLDKKIQGMSHICHTPNIYVYLRPLVEELL